MTTTTMPYTKALITGASSGLGRGLAQWFASRGVKVYAAARRTDALDSLRREVGDAIVPFTLDVANGDDTHARVVALDAECGGLDLVIANAGVGGEAGAKRLDWKVVRNIVDVNVTGALATLCGAMPGMIQRGRGHLVGMSSIASMLAAPRMTTYCASKAFLSNWLEGMRMDVARLGVKVTTLQPGFVKSPMTEKNKPESMPFLLETDDAVDRMARAVVRADEVFTFPWQLATIARSASLMPRGLISAAAKRMK